MENLVSDLAFILILGAVVTVLFKCFFCRRLRSVNALMIIVVDDIDSMPPRNRLFMCEK